MSLSSNRPYWISGSWGACKVYSMSLLGVVCHAQGYKYAEPWDPFFYSEDFCETTFGDTYCPFYHHTGAIAFFCFLLVSLLQLFLLSLDSYYCCSRFSRLQRLWKRYQRYLIWLNVLSIIIHGVGMLLVSYMFLLRSTFVTAQTKWDSWLSFGFQWWGSVGSLVVFATISFIVEFPVLYRNKGERK